MQKNKRRESDFNGRNKRPAAAYSAMTRTRTKIIAAVVFAVTTVAALVVQDLYDEAKNAVNLSPFSIVAAPYDECPQGQWLFPADFDLKTLPGFDRLNSRWSYEHGGYSADESVVDLTFQANGDAAVVLRGMRIEVIERNAPTPGIVVSKCPIRMKPGLDVRRFETDLDNAYPFIVPRESQREVIFGASGDSGVFRGFPYRISQSEPEVFQLTARTTNCSCLWRAKLDWTASGESGTTTIIIGSTPFRTAASGDSETFYYR